jgi:hypothetical protein
VSGKVERDEKTLYEMRTKAIPFAFKFHPQASTMSRQTSLNFAPARKPLALLANTNGTNTQVKIMNVPHLL